MKLIFFSENFLWDMQRNLFRILSNTFEIYRHEDFCLLLVLTKH